MANRSNSWFSMRHSFSSRQLAALCLAAATLCGMGSLSGCDRQEERVDRLEDIADGVSEQINELDEPSQQETDANDSK